MPHRPSAAPPPEPRAAVRGMAALAACVLAADLLLPRTVAVGVLYVLPVLLSLWLANPRITRWSAVLATAAIALGALLSPGGGELWPGLANRAVAVFAVWSVASLGRLRVEVETELRRSREVTRTTLASIAEGVITSDADGRVTFLNQVAETLLGWRRAEAIGRPVSDLLPGRAPDADAAAPDLLPRAGLLHVRRRDGAELVLEASTASVGDPEHPGDGGFGRVMVFRDVTARRAREAAVEALAFRDPLTGLANRQSFEDRLELELAHAERAGKRLGLVFLDLDGFKEVNDTLGHAAGDQMLVAIARRLRDALREEDTVARLGGDEFTVLLPGLGSAADAEVVVAKLLDVLMPAHAIDGREVLAPPSVGLALYPDDLAAPAGDPTGPAGDRADPAGPAAAEGGERRGQAARLLRVADAAMYASKQAGGARWSRPRVAARAPRG
jgi:diguanylate cyclase (GGDEF)-like protein/PAS domain S-box-containing protein